MAINCKCIPLDERYLSQLGASLYNLKRLSMVVMVIVIQVFQILICGLSVVVVAIRAPHQNRVISSG